MSVIGVNKSDFESLVLKSDVPVVVDIWAEWCGPCRMFAPAFEEVAKEYEGKVKFVKINADADDNQKLLEKYSIMSIPTTLLMEKGKVKAMNVGAISKEALRKWLKNSL